VHRVNSISLMIQLMCALVYKQTNNEAVGLRPVWPLCLSNNYDCHNFTQSLCLKCFYYLLLSQIGGRAKKCPQCEQCEQCGQQLTAHRMHYAGDWLNKVHVM